MRVVLASMAASLVSVLVSVPMLGAAPQVGPFHLACPSVPFESIKKARPIDQQCDLAGNATDDEDKAQNRVKNNFCATGSPPIFTTFLTFKKLQAAAVAAVGQGMPMNRAALANLHTTTEGDKVGEGTVIELVGFLINGKFSNVGSGETVNCKQTEREENDIHLNLVQSMPPANPTATELRDLECASVVVEISPHFRPEAWEQLGTLHKTSGNATAAKKIAALDLRRPMRFTGQAFYDATHDPCTGTTPHGSSRRISAWEIHPVYSIDVCVNETLSGCPRHQANRWKSLDNWLAQIDDEGD